MNSKKIFWIGMPIASLFFISACAQTPKSFISPKGYDLNNGEQQFLPDALHEISGIAFPQESSQYIFANEDEHGIVYFFPPGEQNLQEIKFAKKGDYEGVAVSNGYVAVMESSGTIYTFPHADMGQENASNVKVAENLIPKAEYESLAASTADSLLYVLCKKCAVDKGSKSLTGYTLGLTKDGEVSRIGDFKIDEEQIDRLSSLKGKSFRPSALTKNSQTNEWFILSSINMMLVVTNEKWEVIAAYPLNPNIFNQPEAIAFDQMGNLYIGNEGGDKANKATLIKFKLN